MRSFLLFVLLFILPFGCRPPIHPIQNSDASHSVYKIHVDVEVPGIAPPTAGSDDDPDGIFGPAAPSVPNMHIRTTGTAWVVDHVGPHSYLMTAGHVCETGDKAEDSMGIKHDVLSVKYTLEASDGVTIEGARVLVDDDEVDLCVLAVQGDLGDAISIADHDPRYSEEGWYIGAPYGLWGKGIAGIYRTVFMGRGRPFEHACSDEMPSCDRDELAFSSAQAAPGASGSPIIFKGVAVAVLNMGPPKFFTMVMGVPWEDMRKVLSRAKHEEPQESY